MSRKPKGPAQQDADPPKERNVQVTVALITVVGAVLAAVIAGIFGVVNSLVSKTDDKPTTPPSQTRSATPGATPHTSPSGEPCRQLPEPVTSDKYVKISYPGVGINFINYSVTYSRGSEGPFAHIEVSGQISGRIPPRQHLYPFGWSDPATTDSTSQHHTGNGLYYWGQSNQIFPDDNGCWSQLRRKLGYSGAQGLTFRHYYGLISDSDLPCLERLSDANKSDNGLDLDQLTRCGVNFIGYITIPTKHL
ncbi:hypothetical protein ACGFNP_05975 [Nonomuraea sp. NPDC049269]|uniref:hypothetical protein n=1 Tax=Nonomuraea sp. NPDC049269 TaxID=3364349 RepID=UPI00371C6C01